MVGIREASRWHLVVEQRTAEGTQKQAICDGPGRSWDLRLGKGRLDPQQPGDIVYSG